MNIQSYTIVHYGKNYVAWALRSVMPFVSKAHVFYSPHPTHGHSSKAPPIETGNQILEEAKQFDFENKVVWHTTTGITQEGQQRDYAVKTCKEAGADIIIVVDCDEVWHSHVLEAALTIVEKGNARNWLINFTHLWRSFNHCCRDQGWPVRFIDLRQENDSVGYIPKELGDIYHFGYCITDKVMEYKIGIHGHKNEFRPNWFGTKWKNWTPDIKDVHPTNENNWWTPEEFDKEQLPNFLKQHPFWHLERVE